MVKFALSNFVNTISQALIQYVRRVGKAYSNHKQCRSFCKLEIIRKGQRSLSVLLAKRFVVVV